MECLWRAIYSLEAVIQPSLLAATCTRIEIYTHMKLAASDSTPCRPGRVPLHDVFCSPPVSRVQVVNAATPVGTAVVKGSSSSDALLLVMTELIKVPGNTQGS